MSQDLVRRFLFGALVAWMWTLSTSQDVPSLLTGLLSTFATASRNPGCPGECRHALSALFCSHVDEEANCGDPQLRCCTNSPPEAAAPPESATSGADRRRPPIIQGGGGGGDSTFSRPPMLGQTSPISVGTNLTVRPGAPRPLPPRRPVSRPVRRRPTAIPSRTTTTTALAAPIPTAAALVDRLPKPPKTGTPCNGICVASLLASFCTRTSESSQCSPGESCCFTGAEEEMGASVSWLTTGDPTTATATNITTAAVQTTPRIPPTATNPVNATPSTAVASAATTSTTRTVTRTRPSAVDTRRPPTTTTTTAVSRVPPDGDEEECPGSCASGLLSLLCNQVDESVECPNGGKCCIFPSSSDGGDERVTTAKPAIQNCPGICLPSMLSGVCNRPAVLMPETLDCKEGTICCDNSLRQEGPPPTTTTSSPLLDMLSWPLKLGAGLSGHSGEGSPNSADGGSNQSPSATSLLGQTLAGLLFSGAASGLGGGGDDANVDPRPPDRPPIDRPEDGSGFRPPQGPSHPPVDRMQGMQDRPPCPGTCIASFLRMNCFGSFQLDDGFACPKANLVCCAPKTTAVVPPTHHQHPSDGIDWDNSFGHLPPSNSQIIGYTNRPANKYVCGMKGNVRPETPRVVGGRDASPGEWCWQVALINSLNQYLCGGALIGRQWVLTAAHCVTNLIRSGDAIYVRVGDYDLTSKYGSPGAQTLRVATTYIHHNHNSQTLDNNIALLKLEKQVELKEGVCLVCLPARGVAVEPGKRCIVTGYGYMGESGPIPLRIRKVALPIVSEQECVRKINSVTEKIFILPASSFCAGGEEGQDACQGDGGGPLSCEVDGYFEITGIVSWGFGCGRADVPGIYVKVSSFIGWINQIISVNSV